MVDRMAALLTELTYANPLGLLFLLGGPQVGYSVSFAKA